MDNGCEIYRRFIEGDEKAFDLIVDLYRENLIFFINRFVKDTDIAEDIAIDAFCQLYVYKHRYNFKYSLKTYLFTIGKNLAFNYLKKNPNNLVSINELENILPSEESLDEKILIDEKNKIIHNAISTLPEDMQAVIHLIYFENLTYKDAALVMKKNKKQIDNLLFRAKNILKPILKEELL